MADQHCQVIAPLAQRRQVDRADADPVIKIGPELPLLRPLLKIAMRRGDDPHIGANRLLAAEPHKFLLLQDAEDLGLRRQRHVANFVEEKRAAIALLKLADPPPIGSSESPLLMAEQLALK